MPEAIESFQMKYKIIEGFDQALDNKLNDCVSGFYNQLTSLSAFVGPIIGGALFDSVGWRALLNYLMLVNAGFALFLIIFNCGPNVFKKEALKQ